MLLLGRPSEGPGFISRSGRVLLSGLVKGNVWFLVAHWSVRGTGVGWHESHGLLWPLALRLPGPPRRTVSLLPCLGDPVPSALLAAVLAWAAFSSDQLFALLENPRLRFR